MRVIATASVLRHGLTGYTDVFPDLLPEGLGILRASTAEITARFSVKKPVFLSSPAVRALGTTSHAMDAYGIPWDETCVRIEQLLGPIRIMDQRRAFAAFDEVTQGYRSKREAIKAWDRYYMEHPEFEAGVTTEPRSSAKRRFLEVFHAIPTRFGSEQHVVLVTHIETVGSAVRGWFPPERVGGYFEAGEVLHVEFFENGSLRVEFRGKKIVLAF